MSFTQPAHVLMVRPAIRDYPLPFWLFVFFTFIVYVAPQNTYTVLEPLHLARVSALLAFTAYAFQAFVRKEPLFPTGLESRLLAIFTLLICLSIPLSLWPGGSVATVTDLYAKSLIVYLLTVQVLNSLHRFKQMLWLTMTFCFIISLIAIRAYFQGNLVEGYRLEGAWGGTDSNPNDFALTLNLILPFVLALYITSFRALQKVFCAMFVVVSVGLILLTFSRGGFITLIAVLVMFSWRVVWPQSGFRYLVPVVFAVCALVVLMPRGYGERMESIMDSSKDKSGSAAMRLTETVAALEVIVENPVFGVGIGQQGLALNAKGLFWRGVHNVYLQIGAEIGIPGMIVFIFLLIRLLKSARQVQLQFRKKGANQELAMLAVGSEISLVAFCTGALFHPVAYHLFFYYTAGFAVALKTIANHMERLR